MAKSNMSINFGIAFSFILGVFWIMAVVVPWSWLRTENAIVSFRVNLLSVHTYPGVAAMAASFISRASGSKGGLTSSISEFLDQSMWLNDAATSFCTLPVFNWCNQWQMAYWGSIIMGILGLAAAVLFLVGGCALYYYANVHSTETGRILSKFSLVTAPLLGIFGMVAYTALTFQFERYQAGPMSIGSHSSWSYGYVFGCALIPLSFVPVYIMAIFCSTDVSEKQRGDAEIAYGANYGATYGANYGTPGYGAAPHPNYMVAGHGPQIVAAGYGVQRPMGSVAYGQQYNVQYR